MRGDHIERWEDCKDRQIVLESKRNQIVTYEDSWDGDAVKGKFD